MTKDQSKGLKIKERKVLITHVCVCVFLCAGDRGVGAVGARSVSGGGETPKPGGGAGSGESGLDQQLPPVGESPWGQRPRPYLPGGRSAQIHTNRKTLYTLMQKHVLFTSVHLLKYSS